jgi:hypothetical protein
LWVGVLPVEGGEGVEFEGVGTEDFDAESNLLESNEILANEVEVFRAEFYGDWDQEALGIWGLGLGACALEEDTFVGGLLV